MLAPLTCIPFLIFNFFQYVAAHLETENTTGLHYVQYKAEVQVVAGIMYTLKYKGNNEDGVCEVSTAPYNSRFFHDRLAIVFRGLCFSCYRRFARVVGGSALTYFRTTPRTRTLSL